MPGFIPGRTTEAELHTMIDTMKSLRDTAVPRHKRPPVCPYQGCARPEGHAYAHAAWLMAGDEQS
jgi:hypothetical protein